MGKLPSDATQLRNLKSEYRALQRRYISVEANGCKKGKRADEAEANALAWKQRFDALVKRDTVVGEAILAAIERS